MLRLISDKLQQVMCAVLNLIWKLTKSMDNQIRAKLLTGSFMMISICAYCYSIFPMHVHLLIKCLIGTFFMFGILVFSIDREMKQVKWNRIIVFLWFTFGTLRLISGFITSIEYLPLACIWLIGFPLIFFVWNNRKDYQTLFEHIYIGFLYPTFIFFIVSLLFAPIGTVGYTGVTSNANSVGQHIAAIFALIVVRFLFMDQKRIKDVIINTICLWLSVSFAFYSKGRTITVVILGVLLVGAFIGLITRKIGWKILIKKMLVLIIGSLLTISIILPVNHKVTRILPNYSFEENEENSVKLDSALNGYIERLEGKDKAASGIENYSSGRTGIWLEAISKFNLKGHPSRDHIVTMRNGDVGNNAHNVLIQFAYDNGVVAGLCFLLMALVAFYKTLMMCFYNKNLGFVGITILLIEISYWGISLFTSTNLPFLYEISFVYYFVYVVLFDDTVKLEKNVAGE